MNSTLKTGLTIVLLVLVVAGVTLISQFTAKPTTSGPGTGDDPAADAAGALNFKFHSADIHYDPDSENIAYRSFPGFFEVGDASLGDATHWVSFWFRNETPRPVLVMMKERSCTSCTKARIAIVPDDALREYVGRVAFVGLPWSPVPLPDLLSPAAYAGLEARLKLIWHELDFDHPDEPFTVPAAADGRPVVGILGLGFKVTQVGPPKTIYARMAAGVADADRPTQYPFAVTYAPRPAFDLNPAEISIGDLPEGSPPRTTDVYVYSSTRLPGNFPPPVARADDPFVTVGRPVPMTTAEMADLVARGKSEAKVNLRVASGYKVAVTVARDVPGRLPDIGTFEKIVHFSLPGSTHTAPFIVRGRVTGLVRLEDGEKIDLGAYNSAYTLNKSFPLYSNRQDLTLELDPSRCAPLFAQYTLEPGPQSGERKYWTIKVTIPAKSGRRPSWEGVVVLKARGKDGGQTTIRIPVAGNGTGR